MTTSAAGDLDLAAIAPDARPQAMLREFDLLEPGRTLSLASRESLRPLLRVLRVERQGMFEWTPLEDGPSRWRAQVFRRAANRGDLRSVNEALAWDHDRLDALLQEIFRARGDGRYERARELWPVFESGLRRHIGFEENLLFPAFDQAARIPSDEGPTAVMRLEHREIEGILEKLRDAIDEPDGTAEARRADLLNVLGGHNEKEELVLYPGTDRMLSPEDADALVGRIQEF